MIPKLGMRSENKTNINETFRGVCQRHALESNGRRCHRFFDNQSSSYALRYYHFDMSRHAQKIHRRWRSASLQSRDRKPRFGNKWRDLHRSVSVHCCAFSCGIEKTLEIHWLKFICQRQIVKIATLWIENWNAIRYDDFPTKVLSRERNAWFHEFPCLRPTCKIV